MAFTKREQILIERFKRSGRKIDQEKLDAPFGVLVRPLATVGVDAGKFALLFENEISVAIKRIGLTLPVRRVMISPHIIDETTARRPSGGVSFKSKENAIFVAIDIDHSKWVHSSDNSKLTSMYENIRHSLLLIPQTYVGDSGRDILLNVMEDAYTKLQAPSPPHRPPASLPATAAHAQRCRYQTYKNPIEIHGTAATTTRPISSATR
jgi:hypothetical protein